MDLNKFRKQPKRKLAASTTPKPAENAPLPKIQVKEPQTKPKTKRQHIQIEPDAKENKIATNTEPPDNWEAILANLRLMRQKSDAPVDTMGAHKCSEKDATPEVVRYQSLVSLMLSSQTKDQVNFAAMKRLQEHGCTIENILETPDKQLEELLYPVSFYKRKVTYIKKASNILKNDYNGDIPQSVEELCKLPGVGPKMAHICMKVAWDVTTGIGVDTHVHRISNRLGWANTKTPEETRKVLESWLPQELWSEVNHLMVGFGQQICQPVKPHCDTCLNKDICVFGQSFVRNGLKHLKKLKK